MIAIISILAPLHPLKKDPMKTYKLENLLIDIADYKVLDRNSFEGVQKEFSHAVSHKGWTEFLVSLNKKVQPRVKLCLNTLKCPHRMFKSA